jgi:hypothetical protein
MENRSVGYRNIAADIRARADNVSDEQARRAMLMAAEVWERLATHAEKSVARPLKADTRQLNTYSSGFGLNAAARRKARARAKADTMKDLEARRTMLKVASLWEAMARSAKGKRMRRDDSQRLAREKLQSDD